MAGTAREQSRFDELAGGRPAVIYGAGIFGRPIARHLCANGGDVLCFAVDMPSEAWGTTIEGIPVVSVEEAISRHSGEAVFIPTFFHAYGPRFSEIEARFRSRGCTHVASFLHYAWKYPDVFLNYYFVDLPSRLNRSADAIRRCLDLWADEESREEYLRQIRYRANPDREGFPDPVVSPVDYFPTDLFSLTDADHIVDCGGFTGDTVTEFITLRGAGFGQLTVFEADASNFEKLTATVRKLPPECSSKIVRCNQAVGAAPGFVEFVNAGYDASSVIGTRNLSAEVDPKRAAASAATVTRVECVTLDAAVGNPPPTLIKMDIEGAELDALAGCRNLIADRAPILAISVYHTQSHLWEIPLFVADLRPDYRFHLRRYSEHPWDTVMFAVPPSNSPSSRGTRS